MHRRFAPRRHQFEYGIFMLALDLDELDDLSRELRLFSRNGRNLYEFRDRDHLEYPQRQGSSDLKQSIIAWLQAQEIQVAMDARVTLITLPRVAGYIFNPVSFYFVETRDRMPVCAVSEVGNTFGELKPYLVPVQTARLRVNSEAKPPTLNHGTDRFRRIVPKHFYVSPFSGLDLCFDFKLRTPGDRLELVVNDVTTAGETLLISTLVGDRVPLTDGQLVRLTMKYPLVTLRIITLIHWHALKLWWKRLPWHPKAAHRELQRDVFRPHASLRDPTKIVAGMDTPVAAPTNIPVA